MNRQEYLLVCLVEELSEMQHAASKCLRFTPEDVCPERKIKNRLKLQDELNDVVAVLEMLYDDGFSLSEDDARKGIKKQKLARLMERSRELGVLS